MTTRLMIAPLAVLASCAPPPAADPVPPAQQAERCAILASRDWAAWVNAMPGPGAAPTLIVIGKVDTPTGGYRIGWRDMRVMESFPVQIVVELDAIPPSGPATQAIVTHEVIGQWPSQEPVGSVTVRCGGTVLARIAPVETAR